MKRNTSTYTLSFKALDTIKQGEGVYIANDYAVLPLRGKPCIYRAVAMSSANMGDSVTVTFYDALEVQQVTLLNPALAGGFAFSSAHGVDSISTSTEVKGVFLSSSYSKEITDVLIFDNPKYIS